MDILCLKKKQVMDVSPPKMQGEILFTKIVREGYIIYKMDRKERRHQAVAIISIAFCHLINFFTNSIHNVQN